ncbi:protein delta homolog 1 [Phyllobates terribilis]|uniref:protein delta homolog 1 n=1 Tax=Phyllobates terribilis TaxID=111132 RepID=UPI003CCA8BA2
MELPILSLCFILSRSIVSATQGACRPGCHPINGYCESPGECRCHAGWKGPFCDQCIQFPGCVHGSCDKPWQCICDEGWIGSHCNIDIHPCASVPCSSNSTCIETGDGGYICLCAPGFTGKNCLVKRGPCNTNGSPCKNGGTCTDHNGFASQASCQCPSGFEGNKCEVKKNGCNPNPCANGGNCTDVDTGFQCKCLLGFTGQSCKEVQSLCSSSPCAHGGTCHEKIGEFQCTCPPEYRGATCEVLNTNKKVHTMVNHVHFQPHHKIFPHQGHEVLKITMKETVHNMDPFLSRSQIICFIVLGLLTCLIVLITTGIVFFSRCETWLANAKYSHLIRKKKDFYMKADKEAGNDVKIIFPEKVKIANYNRNYTTI